MFIRVRTETKHLIMGSNLIVYVTGSVLFASVLAAPMQHAQTSNHNNGVGNQGNPSLEDRVLVVERKLNLNEHKLNQVDDQMLYIIGIIMHQLNWTNPSYGQNNENIYNQSSHTTNQNVNQSSTATHALQEQAAQQPANHHQQNRDQSQSNGAPQTPNHQTNVRNNQQQTRAGPHRNNPFGRLFSFEQNSMERTLSRIFFNQPLGGTSTGVESFEDLDHHPTGLNTRNAGQYAGGRGVGNIHSNNGNRNNYGNLHGTTSQDSLNANSERNPESSSPNRNQHQNSGVRSDTNSGNNHADSHSTTTKNNDHSAASNNQQTNINPQNGSPSDKAVQKETPIPESNHPDIFSDPKNRQNENTTETHTETIARSEQQTNNGHTGNDWQNEQPTIQTGRNNKQEPTIFTRPEDNMTPSSDKNNQHPETGDPEFLGENETEWGKEDNKFENTHDGENKEHSMIEEEQETGGNQYYGEGEEGVENEGNNADQEEAAPETQQATDLGELQAEHPGESPFESAPRPLLPAEVEN